MFDCEVVFQQYWKKYGQKEVVEFLVDINWYIVLYVFKECCKDDVKFSLEWVCMLFDYNEYFIEFFNMGEEDCFVEFMVVGLLWFVFGVCLFFWMLLFMMDFVFFSGWYIFMLIGVGMIGVMGFVLFFFWLEKIVFNYFMLL